MKKGIHPENYRLVAFKDMSNNDVFITKSAVETKDTISVDGAEYPLVKLEISRTSHPYYTGKTKLVDTAGRIDKFKSRYANLLSRNNLLKNLQLSKKLQKLQLSKKLQFSKKLQKLQLSKKLQKLQLLKKHQLLKKLLVLKIHLKKRNSLINHFFNFS